MEHPIGSDAWDQVTGALRQQVHQHGALAPESAGDVDRERDLGPANFYEREVVETWDQPLQPLLQVPAGFLNGATRLVIIPHSAAHLIPWPVVAFRAGLRQPDGSEFPIRILPALGIVPRLRHRSRSTGQPVILGDPLGDLFHARREALDVAAAIGGSAKLGPAATKAALKEHLTTATIIHLATHAFFNSDSALDSGIVLADGIFKASDLLEHRLTADLVVLSACSTGMAKLLPGDELVGLAQSFLLAGAGALLVSLWPVDDPATATFMQDLYTAKKAGADTAEAVTTAMAQLRTQAHRHHAYYWGAFVLIGDLDDAT
jgi:hypothetical protein